MKDRSPESTNQEEAALLVGFANRVDGAEQFVERFKPLIWSLSRRFCANRSDVEDAVQDILLELWRTADRFDPGRGSAGTFVATVARRRLIDRYRRLQARPPMEEMPEGATSSGASAEARAMMSSIFNALAQLKPAHREVLVMSFVHGYTHVEIASIMSLPLGTVKTIARRSVQRVREELCVA